MTRTKLNTYCRVRGGLLYRRNATYTKKEKSKICSYFPSAVQEIAFNETFEHVSELISRLASPGTPQNIKRSVVAKDIRKLLKCSQDLYELLKYHLRCASCYSTIEYKTALYKYIDPLYPQMDLSKYANLIYYSMLASEDALKRINLPGTKDPHYHNTIENLGYVWEKYNKRKPARSYNHYSPDKTKGEFIDYLEASINPAILRANNKKIINSKNISVSRIAREIIDTKFPMAKTSIKQP